jgi:hypothetical protein
VGIAVDQDEGADPLGMGDGEMDRFRAGHVLCHQRRSLQTYGVEHGEEISVEDLSHQGIPAVTLR